MVVAGRIGLRGRLLIAFFGISAFAVIAAVAAVYSLIAVRSGFDLVTGQRVPAALNNLEISLKAERIVNAAPTLLVAASDSQRKEIVASISTDVDGLLRQVANLE